MNDNSIKIYNSLSKKVEEFSSINPNKVLMYHCGPTVYDDAHIGNMRAFLLADLLRRMFEWNNYTVLQVMNITDIGHLVGDGDQGEDKMTSGLKRLGQEITIENMLRLGEKYQKRFEKDLERMQIKKPHHLTKASKHIKESIEIIKILERKGFIYTTEDSVYFDTDRFPDYGALGLSPTEESRSRTGINNQKKNPRDFALWKKDERFGWPSPWGQGFPGWHIECSGMSRKYLGENFDIHTGGIDLAPTHHNNEIAQSTCSSGSTFVNYWIHNEHVDMGKVKMSKSLGNHATLTSLEQKGFDSLDYRYWLMQGKYRTKVNFSIKSLAAAKTARQKLKGLVTNKSEICEEEIDAKHLESFTKAINNDLSTPEALEITWEVAKDKNISEKERTSTLLKFNEFLGIFDTKRTNKSINIPEEVKNLLKERTAARKDKDWQKSDKLRNQIKELGFTVKDKEGGAEITPN